MTQDLTPEAVAEMLKRLRDFYPHEHELEVVDEAADMLEALAAENKLLNDQLDAIEEEGTESLNALPDCRMKLAPALVRIDGLEAKLAKAVEALTAIAADASVPVRTGKDGIKYKKMYKGWRKIATTRIDIARAAFQPKETDHE